MATEITVPRQGWSMEEAIFSVWLKAHGEMVRSGDALFAVESDKATQEIESFDGGLLYLAPDAPKPGEKVGVGQVIGYLLAEGESAPSSGVRSQESGVRSQVAAAAVPVEVPVPVHSKPEASVSTPRARRVAEELNIDWSSVPGTGRGGRIREADIRKAAAASATRKFAAVHTMVPVTLHTTADATALVGLHDDFKKADSAAGAVIPSCGDMLVKLAAIALQKHPVLNSRWDGETLRTSPDIHIGIAIDTESGLRIPVIHDPSNLPLRDIARRSRELTERAHAAQLTADEMRGGTFTITDLGAFGIDTFTPTITEAECATLGLGRILRQPVASGDGVAFRDIITLSLTFDRRVCEDAPAARFLQTLVGLIESPVGALFF